MQSIGEPSDQLCSVAELIVEKHNVQSTGEIIEKFTGSDAEIHEHFDRELRKTLTPKQAELDLRFCTALHQVCDLGGMHDVDKRYAVMRDKVGRLNRAQFYRALADLSERLPWDESKKTNDVEFVYSVWKHYDEITGNASVKKYLERQNPNWYEKTWRICHTKFDGEYSLEDCLREYHQILTSAQLNNGLCSQCEKLSFVKWRANLLRECQLLPDTLGITNAMV
jgi:hypothetical protein